MSPGNPAREVIARSIVETMFDDGVPFEQGATPAEAADAYWADHCEYADRIIAALSAAGMVVVPREPTKAMQDALIETVADGITINDDANRTARHAYRAMLDAALNPPGTWTDNPASESTPTLPPAGDER